MERIEDQAAAVHLDEVGGGERRGGRQQRVEAGKLQNVQQPLVSFVMLSPCVSHCRATADGHRKVENSQHPVPNICKFLCQVVMNLTTYKIITRVKKPSGNCEKHTCTTSTHKAFYCVNNFEKIQIRALLVDSP